MNETEVNLIREYVLIHYLIKEAVETLDTLKSSRISLTGLLVFATKSTGTKLKDKLKAVQSKLRAAGIHVWIEDDGDEIIYVGTAKNGVKGRHGIKRRILREDMEAKLMEYASEFMHGDFNFVVNEPYKVERLPDRDPYEHIKK
jgi:hypothetical protein